ncbi:hypothetical protein ACKI16_30855 [Streptomyces scabiei]|uniref:hypothetical protein n=1 Tax=Streptomyces scabiei TaxID=1930 RepID=UPI0038F68A23
MNENEKATGAHGAATDGHQVDDWAEAQQELRTLLDLSCQDAEDPALDDEALWDVPDGLDLPPRLDLVFQMAERLRSTEAKDTDPTTEDHGTHEAREALPADAPGTRHGRRPRRPHGVGRHPRRQRTFAGLAVGTTLTGRKGKHWPEYKELLAREKGVSRWKAVPALAWTGLKAWAAARVKRFVFTLCTLLSAGIVFQIVEILSAHDTEPAIVVLAIAGVVMLLPILVVALVVVLMLLRTGTLEDFMGLLAECCDRTRSRRSRPSRHE